MNSRLDRACRLLKESGAGTVAAIAKQCGFASSQYFTRVFHHRIGCTPAEYRKRGEASH
jgi:AraC-like DNA-binding protein